MTSLQVFGLVVLYFTPSFISLIRKQRKARLVCLVDIAFGWTVVGWIVALILSLDREPRFLTDPLAAVAAYGNGDLTAIEVDGFLPNRDEHAYYAALAQILVEYTDKTTRGGYGGFSYRVAPRMTARVGRFSSHQDRTITVVVGDTGRLIITDQRLVYVGDRSTLAAPLRNILNIESYPDGFRVNLTDASPVHFRTGEPTAAIILRRACEGTLACGSSHVHTPSLQTPS